MKYDAAPIAVRRRRRGAGRNSRVSVDGAVSGSHALPRTGQLRSRKRCSSDAGTGSGPVSRPSAADSQRTFAGGAVMTSGRRAGEVRACRGSRCDQPSTAAAGVVVHILQGNAGDTTKCVAASRFVPTGVAAHCFEAAVRSRRYGTVSARDRIAKCTMSRLKSSE